MKQHQLVEQLQSTSVSMVLDALIKLGYSPDKILMSGIKPVVNLEKVMVGVARTLKYEISRDFPSRQDFTIARRGIDEAAQGEVLIQDGSGYPAAFFGGIFARACKNRGIVGAVIDGATRDVLEIKSMGLHVFAKGATPLGGAHYFRASAANVRVNCGNVQVDPGNIIVGDGDGVIVIPDEAQGQISAALKEIAEKEKIAVQSLEAGKSLVDSYPTIEFGNIKV